MNVLTIGAAVLTAVQCIIEYNRYNKIQQLSKIMIFLTICAIIFSLLGSAISLFVYLSYAAAIITILLFLVFVFRLLFTNNNDNDGTES